MSLLTKVGAFSSGTGAIGTTVVVNDVGFQPKALILWWTKSAASVDEVVNGTDQQGFGFATATTQRCCANVQSEDASASSDADSMYSNIRCVIIQSITGAFEGALDFQSFDSGGFTLVVDDAFPYSLRIHYMALGGDISAYVADWPTVSAPGNQTVTGVGFQPDIVFFWTSGSGAVETRSNGAYIAFGVGMSSTKGIVAMSAQHNGELTMVAKRYGLNTGAECVVQSGISGAVTITKRAAISSMNSDGFVLNWLEAPTPLTRFGFLAIKGGSWDIGESLTKQDTTTDIVVNGLNFTPSCGMILSHCDVESTQDTVQAHASVSIGAFTNPTERGAQAHFMEDATTDSETTFAVEHDEVYINISTTDTVQALMDIKSVNQDGATFIMDDADVADNWFGWVMGGNPHPPDIVLKQEQNAVYRM